MAASDFLQTIKEKPMSLQTLSNRDLVNRMYFERYEDCVQMMTITNDYHTQAEFQNRLKRLYWSFVVPRLKYLENEGLSIAIEQDKLEGKIRREEAEDLLKKIGYILWYSGVVRTEKKETEPDHAFIEEKETTQ